ncbi:MAG: sulfotransferase [Bacteroidales bacterium]|jgi:LPS sulfotransferase NodH|nr:sulfotransferase [Bacteroidales bacterium]
MNPERNRLPLTSSLINAGFSILVKGRKGQLDIEKLKQAAIKKTGLQDFGDPYFEEGLERLITLGNADTNLNNIGKLLLKSSLEHNLSNRLLFCNELKKNDTPAETRQRSPIIVTGIPRSGTTFLHRLILQDEGNYGTPLWEMLRPINKEGKNDRRKLKARLEWSASNFIKGNINHIHYTSHREPEECIYLFGITFNALLYYIQFPLYPYIDWYLQADRNKKYREYADYLRILQSFHPGKRLVMKSPEHFGSVREIRKVLPNALILQIHRDPLTCFLSMNSMLYHIHKSASRYSDKKRLALTNMKLFEHELARNKAFRREAGPGVIDVFYEDLVADPFAVLKDVYAKAGLDFSEAFSEAVQNYAKANPKDKFGAHQYDAADFGLNENEIRDKLDPLSIGQDTFE